MEVSPAAALRDVEIATRSRRLAESDFNDARKEQINAIRLALTAGCSQSEVAQVAGVSRQWVNQLQYDQDSGSGAAPPGASGPS
jgi:hypothetical protein